MEKKILILLCIALPFSILAQDVKLGLKFTPTDQLRGIPMASTPFAGDELPSTFDLSNRMPPAGDQGRQSSCVAWAVGYACKSYQEKYEEGSSFFNGGAINKNAVFSPSFIYNQINNGVDGGSLFIDALNLVSQQGAVKWSDMPYNESDYTTRPNNNIKDRAKKYKIDFWRQVNAADSKEVKAQLNAGFPVIIGAMIDRGFVNNGRNSVGQDFIWNNYSGQQLGGHAMIVVGYDDNRSAFKVLNSWGQNWGNNGYCWISYSFFPNTVREAYVMKDAINGTDTNPTPRPVVNPTSDLTATFRISNVQHNIQDMQQGQIMRIHGMVNLPQGIGRKVQVVVKFYLNNGSNGKGVPVGSLSNYFMMPDGSAATGTPKSDIIPGNQQWYVNMPYQTLKVNRGRYAFGIYQPFTTYLIAEPILYIDDFAVETGGLIPFFVKL
ncbi:papain family cysteine protease [Kordia sp. SMS9]|uniref:C1 family peptidase n=1 Tax=Kordia sp. SMS9 TaxID=2282170 RepID=UPI000E0D8B70|nr:C1 family peptidase [Kordia sp. SMS9]AXG70548.1 papain family cysteine protease [Kordia sp. SMS9]